VWLAIAAIATSIGLWLLGTRLLLSAQAATAERLPDSWRRRAPDSYSFIRSLRTRDILRETNELLPLLALGISFFGVLTAFEVDLGVQLGFAAVLAGLWTWGIVSDRLREQEAYRLDHGLDRPPSDRPLVVRYYGALFVACLGIRGCSAFQSRKQERP
jgi:hypothetical protein